MVKKKPPVDPLETSLKALQKNGAIHIRALRFPNYKSLVPNARLPLEFPVTLLLGRNGTNKTSILHALYGSAKGRTIGDFWFETKLDAIPETKSGMKQSVTHTYLDKQSNEVECIKARAPRGDADPDYWESVKPTAVYGFAQKAKRVPPISLQVMHLDFRAELPAFDKYFYFPDPGHLAQLQKRATHSGTLRRDYRKQDYLRRRSTLLMNRLDTEGKPLPEEGLEVIRYILERDYASATLLDHNIFHGHVGRTVRFKTPDVDGGYSDAFAGSGESAATFLVHDVLAGAAGSLILLDEPETSLHPRAQRRMLEFLCHQAVRKSLQIVIATHSSHLAEHLPQVAIRVLERTNEGVRISTSHSAREALHEIDTIEAGRTVIVEDVRAQHLVLSAMDSVSKTARNEIRVQVRDGGTSRIFKDIQAHANSGRTDVFFLLDGDHCPEKLLPSAKDWPQGLNELSQLVSQQTKGPNKAGQDFAFVDAGEATTYLNFLHRFVRYLPSQTPEELVWNDVAAANLVKVDVLPDVISGEPDFKEKLALAAAERPGLSTNALFESLVAEFLEGGSSEKETLDFIINEIRNAK